MSLSVAIAARRMTAWPAAAQNPQIFVNVTDARIAATDFAGTLLRQDQVLRITRSIDSGAGDSYRTTAPAARASFVVRMPPGRAGLLEMNVRYTGLVTRLDLYRPLAPVLVNGRERFRFTLGGWTSGNPHPIGNVQGFTTLEPGENLVEIVFPYGASFDVQSIRVPAEAIVEAPPARPQRAIVFVGDSITHGFNTDTPPEHWPWKLADALRVRQLNLGYGGRITVPADLTAARGTDASAAIWTTGTNDYLAQRAVSAYGADLAAGIANWFAGGNTRPLWLQSPPWIGGTALAIPIASYRTEMAARVAAAPQAAGGLVRFIDSTAAGFPTGVGDFPDNVHPNAAACTKWAAALTPLIRL